MNKKFSTLVACALLATSVGASAQINMTAGLPLEGITYTDAGKVAYKVGQSYVLGVDGTTNSFLAAVPQSDGKILLQVLTTLSALGDANQATWTLQQLIAPEGAVAPKYVFVNKATNTVLAMDKSKAVAYNATTPADASFEMGGEQTEWLSSISYKEPETAPIYAALADDNVLALVKASASANVYLAKMKKTDLNVALQIRPYQMKAATYRLSANDLNTMLGTAGKLATKESFFNLSFAPEATMNGDVNKLTADLQAVVVDQYAVKYATEDDAVKADFASLNPLTDASTKTKVSEIQKGNDISFDRTNATWVTLKNRDGKYLVVDTTIIKGTQTNETGRFTFAYDDLFDAKSNTTRFRNPESYLFAFVYNPTSGSIQIQSKAYYTGDATPNPTAFTEATYYDTYAAQASKVGSKFYTTTATEAADATDARWIIKAALVNLNEVTVGVNADDNQFAIKLGASKMYQTTYMTPGAYVLKIVGSTDVNKVGKYYVNNLKGVQEFVEQAVRQNFQDMPAAQWILTNAGTGNGASATVVNREFGNNLSIANGSLYSVAGADAKTAFFYGQDTLQFIPVAKAADKYLGYKYVANDSIAESIFTFNYLHDLAMDKPINIKFDSDSVVWVDKDGASTKFILETVIADDTYGTNGKLTGVANLLRNVYVIKVNDATKLENDKRYLKYDSDRKKYVVSEQDQAKADRFFLKENNEVEGGACYYALVRANLVDAIKADGTGYAKMVNDANVADMYLAAMGKVTDSSTGLEKDGWVVAQFDNDTDDATKKLAVSLNADIVSFGTAGKFAIKYEGLPATYADLKVSVDNNTLDLVNGILNDGNATEVATSAFAVTKDNNPYYRRFNTVNEGVASNAPDTVKFYRVNAAAKEYLYEDANSVYSKDKGINFLGVEDKGISAKASIYVDTAYVRNNTIMPQYMLAFRPEFVQGETILCDATTHAHATPEEALACPHTKITPSYVDAAYLVNLQDSVDMSAGAAKAKFQWNNAYTRLGFVDARHIHDTLVIKNSIYTGNNKPMTIGKAATWASKDSIFLGDNKHKNVAFAFRLVKTGSNDFLIESVGDQAIPTDGQGGWVKIQNGVPVIAKYATYKEAGLDAEIFNVEATSEAPTTNEGIEANAVSVTADFGKVIIKNAEGKTVAISNILGQAIANTVISSDNATITVPAGIVVVSVEGEEAVKAIVK